MGLFVGWLYQRLRGRINQFHSSIQLMHGCTLHSVLGRTLSPKQLVDYVGSYHKPYIVPQSSEGKQAG